MTTDRTYCTVGELIASCPEGTQVLAEGDLSREIRWVHPTEMADPSGYLEGGEVILTAGLWLDSGVSAASVVKNFGQAEVAAVGLGLTVRNPAAPAPLVSACNRAGLTLFSVPIEVPFLAIMQTFVEIVTRAREAPLREVVRRNERFVRAASVGDPLDQIVSTLSSYCTIPLRLITPQGATLAEADSDHELDDALILAALDGGAGEGDRVAPEAAAAPGVSLFPIGQPGSQDGFLVAGQPPDELSLDRWSVIQQALPFLAVAFARNRALLEAERRFGSELIDLLMAGDQMRPATQARLEALGFDLDQPLVAVVGRAPHLEDSLGVLERFLTGAGIRATLTTKRDEIVAIMNWDGDEQDLLASLREAHAQLPARAGEVAALGLGSPAQDVAELRKSLVEARYACWAAKARQGGGCASHTDVGSHLLLLALQDPQIIDSFRTAILEPLMEHDAKSNISLIETLSEFLKSGGKWRDTARELHIHVNTLRHRLRRVESLTGRDLTDMRDRVDFYVALRSLEPEETRI